jgi:hypothetical protein
MIFDCGTTEDRAGAANADTPSSEECRACTERGTPVSRRTVLFMLKPHLLEQASTGTFRLCGVPACPTVYFEEDGNRVFTTKDLRVIVGLKAEIDPIPVCYCFGFDESHLRDEIASTGSTTIPDKISSLIREGLCACDTRNPSGNCCLGQVNQAVKRLKQKVQ